VQKVVTAIVGEIPRRWRTFHTATMVTLLSPPPPLLLLLLLTAAKAS